jgi:hypothetical protein
MKVRETVCENQREPVENRVVFEKYQVHCQTLVVVVVVVVVVVDVVDVVNVVVTAVVVVVVVVVVAEITRN